MNCQLLRLPNTRILVHYSLAVNLNIKVSKILHHWILLLNPFGFCETEYLHFTTRVVGHDAITPFLGGWMSLYTHMNASCCVYEWVLSYIWWVFIHILLSHVVHINQSLPTYEWDTCTYECVILYVNAWRNVDVSGIASVLIPWLERLGAEE